MTVKWEKTPFETLKEARAFARNADLIIEPLGQEGIVGFKAVDKKTETLIIRRPEGILSLTLVRAKRQVPSWEAREITLGEDPPWQWSPAVSSLAAVERLFSQEPVMRGDYIAYRSEGWVHEYLIACDDQVYQRLIRYKEETE